MRVFVRFCTAALAFGEYSLSALMMAYTCLYSGNEEEKSVNRRFVSLFSIIMNPSESRGVVQMGSVRVDFTSGVETRDSFSLSL